MKIKGVIFDLDGTLLDSMSIWDSAAEKYLKTKGIKADGNIRDILKPMSLQQSAEYLKKRYSISDSTDKVMGDINKTVEDFYLYDAILKDGAGEFLKYLSDKKIKMCVATATDKYLVKASLERNGVLEFFDKIFTCSDIGHGKDEPDIYREALKHLGSDISETLVFEDALHATMTAKNAGFTVCGIYDKSENNAEKLKKTVDVYINSFNEARDYID